MINVGNSLQDFSDTNKTSLENILDQTNHEYDKGYNSLVERESILYNKMRQYNISTKTLKNRIKNLMGYSNEMELKKKIIDSDMASLESQFQETCKSIDSEISINEKTLEKLNHEHELLISKLSYYSTNSEQLHSKLNQLEGIEKDLSSRISEINKKIRQFEANAPKRPPEKIKKEISIVLGNIPEVNKQIKITENNIIQKAFKKIKSQTEASSLKEQTEIIRLEISEIFQKGDLKNETIRSHLNSKIERVSSIEATQHEKSLILNNIKNRIEYQHKKNIKLSKTVKETYQKVEETKNKLLKMVKDTEAARQQKDEYSEKTKILIRQRTREDAHKAAEMSLNRNKIRNFQKKIGSEKYKKEQNDQLKTSLKEKLIKMQKSLEDCQSESIKNKVQNQELKKLEEEKAEKEFNEQRQYKSDVITLNDLQKTIGQEQTKQRQMIDERMNFLSVPTIEKPGPIEFPDLKKELKLLFKQNEQLKYNVTKIRIQRNTLKKELLMKIIDLEQAKGIQQYLEHEKVTYIETEMEDKLIKLRFKKHDNSLIIQKIEKKQINISERKKAIQIKANHINEVADNQRCFYFGNNVALVVSKDYPRCQNKHRMDEINVNKIIGFEKLIGLYRRIQIERDIWSGCVNNNMTVTGILETWQDELQKYP